jgi:hypothetical protein
MNAYLLPDRAECTSAKDPKGTNGIVEEPPQIEDTDLTQIRMEIHGYFGQIPIEIIKVSSGAAFQPVNRVPPIRFLPQIDPRGPLGRLPRHAFTSGRGWGLLRQRNKPRLRKACASLV